MWLHVPRGFLSAASQASTGLSTPLRTRTARRLWSWSNGTPTLLHVSLPAWRKVPFLPLLSGTTCPRSTLRAGVAWWMRLLAEARAQTSPSPTASGSASTETGAASSSSSSGLPRTAEPSGSSGRTLAELRGMFRRYAASSEASAGVEPGRSFRQVTLAPPSAESESSFWPTSTAQDARSSGWGATSPREGTTRHTGTTLTDAAVRIRDWGGDVLWPTASARDWKNSDHSSATAERNSRPLNEAAWSWTKQHMTGRTRWAELAGPGWGLWQGPCLLFARRGLARIRLAALTSRHGPRCLNYDPTLHRLVLNPAFVEWLMGMEPGQTVARIASGAPATQCTEPRPRTPSEASGEPSSGLPADG
jgi:hypothetical protein